MGTVSAEAATRRTLLAGAASALGLGALGLAACGRSGSDEIVLINHLGQEVRWGALKGVPRALFFGFTHCPVICPVTIYELTDAMDKIGANDLVIDFITVDPERDSAPRLREYFSGFGPRVRAYTGTPEAIAQLARAYEVTYKRQDLENGDYTMDHTATVFLLDAQARVVDVVAYGSPPDVLQSRLRSLVGAAPRA